MTAAGVTSRIRIDNKLDIAILEIRASDTGDVVNQYPTKAQIQAFGRAAELDARREAVETQAEGDTGVTADAPEAAVADSGVDVPDTVTTAEAAPAPAAAPAAYTDTGAAVTAAPATTEQTI